MASHHSNKASIIQKIEDLLKPVYLETSDNLDRLLQDFNTGQTVAVSDGSFFPETGASAAAWIIESKCQTQWIRGSLLTPGPIQDFSAYRSELTGLLAISVTLKILASCTRSPKHTIIGCDGKAALQVLTLSKHNFSPNKTEPPFTTTHQLYYALVLIHRTIYTNNINYTLLDLHLSILQYYQKHTF